MKADGKQEMYGRSGFKTFVFDDYQLVAKAKLVTDDNGLESIKEYTHQDFDKLAAYDRKISPYDRSNLLGWALKICYENFEAITYSKPYKAIFPWNKYNFHIS